MTFFRPLVLALLLCLTLTAPGIQAQTPPAPVLGRDFVRLDPLQPVSSGDQVEVIEFFYYGCPVCYELEPALSSWTLKMRDSVNVRRIPALATSRWENFAKLYYTLDVLNELERLHWPVYDNVHVDDVKLNNESVMLDWVSSNGIDRQKFIDTYASAAIQEKVAAAKETIRKYGIKGVPSVVVDGKYLTSARIAGSTRKLIQVLDYLVERARSERKKS